MEISRNIMLGAILPSGMGYYVFENVPKCDSKRAGVWIIDRGPGYFGILCNSGNPGFPLGAWEYRPLAKISSEKYKSRKYKFGKVRESAWRKSGGSATKQYKFGKI